ncbi:MAG: 3-deoxy-manno-octulosonate cytidylyltransferase [Nitrospinales bacterium]
MPTEPKVAAIIPARWGSTRFPGKPLAEIRHKPMIQWVVEKARQAKLVSEVFVATDDQKIFDAVSGFGGKAIMTSPDHPTGTDRIAEAASGISCDFVVNVQGDEPLVLPDNIDLTVEALLQDDSIQVSTLMAPIQGIEEIFNANVTKVVADLAGFALYFSRSPIPYFRDRRGDISVQVEQDARSFTNAPWFKHIGIYAYSRSFVRAFPNLSKTAPEEYEGLEQLRILGNSIPIKVIETRENAVSVNCPEDIQKVESLLGASESDPGKPA